MDDSIGTALQNARESRNAGSLAEAYRHYVKAASLARASSEKQMLAHALRHASDVGREIGRLAESLDAGHEAVTLFKADAASAPLDLANALRVTALALQELGHKDEAKPLWREARALYDQVAVAAGVAECDVNL